MTIPFDSLEELARSLALEQQADEGGRPLPLLPRLVQSAKTLESVCAHWSSELRHGKKVSDVAVWLTENQLFVQGHTREVKQFLPRVYYGKLPRLKSGPFAGYPRIYGIAVDLLLHSGYQVSREAVLRFTNGYQSSCSLTIGELWALGAMLRLALIEDLARVAEAEMRGEAGDSAHVGRCILSLRAVSQLSWKEFFEEVSRVERILREDPSGVYPKMDFPTRDQYRHELENFAAHSRFSEEQVASMLIERAARGTDELTRHVGYYLIDAGAPAFKREIAFRPPWEGSIGRFLKRHPELCYLGGIELATFLIIAVLLSQLPAFEPQVIAFFLLFLPATGAAVSIVNQAVTMTLPPKSLPRLDFSGGIPEDCATIVVVPTLLLSRDFVARLLEDLEVRYLANPDPQLSFALLTDFPDAPQPAPDDQELVQLCADGIRKLNERYAHHGRHFFYLFHRGREWNPKQVSFMGWERKRGKLIHFNNLLCGESDEFPVKEGDLSVLPRIRYVLTLDTDTQLPRDSARKMVATIAHPLNRPVVDPRTKTVCRGYGILQPRVGISVHSAGRTHLARIYSGQTGIDLYTTAVSDVYQDLFRAGIYTGKGLYDVKVFQEVLSHRFPHDALLSHDLLEGEYARAGLVTDIEVIDDYPSHYGAYNKRKHRWVRGDWQVTLWLLPRVPNYEGKLVPNPLELISRWKIFDNLRRSLLEITTFVLLTAGWLFLPGGPVFWTVAVLALTLLPTWMDLVLSLIRFPERRFLRVHFREAGFRLLAGHLNALLSLTFLPHQALLMVDAIARTIARTISGRRLLEWESAAEAERSGGGSFGSLHSYLWISALLSAGLGAFIMFRSHEAIAPAMPIIAAWVLAPVVAMWLNSPIRPQRRITEPEDCEFLTGVARRTWAYFEDFNSERENYLIPDNYQADLERVAHRTSPTNIGLLLNANLAAVDFGFITIEEFTRRTRRTMDTMERMEVYRGHFYNWYDTETLAPLWPLYVSTVDSGNLAAALLTLKQGCLQFAAKCGSPDLSVELQEIAETCSNWFERMDFSFLYDRRKKVFTIGYDPVANRMDEYHYDLLASEARTASFLAIAKGDVPQEHWFHLGRTMTLYAGQRVLLSWSGTMFEYLMPLIWMRNWPGTLLDRTSRAVIRCQQAYARERRVPWGISESAHLERDAEGNYQYHAFGLPPICLRQDQPEHLVIAPYAAALALPVLPGEALENLKAQANRGWLGKYSFYDAVQFPTTASGKRIGRGEPVHAFMVHHLGMTLLAIDNALNEGKMQERFHADPLVQASELLLQERVPPAAWVARPQTRGGSPIIPFDTEETREATAGSQ